MHCELIVPGLLPAGEAFREALGALKTPALELLAARGRRSAQAAIALEHWLAAAFSLPPVPLAAGALTMFGFGAEPGEACWLRCDPVHLEARREGLVLIPAAGFSLAADEAARLIEALNRHFAGAFEIQAPHPECWCLRAAGEVALQAKAPIALAGAAVDESLPRGPDEARWHAVLTEAQMLLHAHPVNAARERRGEPAVNSVWLWGAGTMPRTVRGRWHSVGADDPVVLGLARAAGMRHRAVPESAHAWLERAPEDGRHAIVLDALRGPRELRDLAAWSARLQALESRWFAPLLEALRSGRIGMLSVHLPEAGLSFETMRLDLRRFWRRTRNLALYEA